MIPKNCISSLIFYNTPQTPRYKNQQTRYCFTSPFAATPELE